MQQLKNSHQIKTRYLIQCKIDEEGYSLDGIWFDFSLKFKDEEKAKLFVETAPTYNGTHSYRIVEYRKEIKKLKTILEY